MREWVMTEESEVGEGRKRERKVKIVFVGVDKGVNDSATGHMTPKHAVMAMRYLGVCLNRQVLALYYLLQYYALVAMYLS
jgi:hypothetical protein